MNSYDMPSAMPPVPEPEEESPKIEMSRDPENLARLQAKLKDYKRRLTVQESQYVPEHDDLLIDGESIKKLRLTADTRYKIAVLERLLLSGSVDKNQLHKELVNRDKTFDQSTYDNAFDVIEDYAVTGGEGLTGGTGL